MKPIRFTLLAVLLVPAVVFGQPGPTGSQPGGNKNNASMYEDIEIMRQLLSKALVNSIGSSGMCANCHRVNTASRDVGAEFWVAPMVLESANPNAGTKSSLLLNTSRDVALDIFVANNPHHTASPFFVEGAYLKGHGVAFHITLPNYPKEELVLTGPSVPKQPLSDWERTRGQLRGVNTPATPTMNRATLADALARVLAENGKYFSHLAETENLTIVVTFRGHAHHHTHTFLRGGMAGGGPGMSMGGGMAPVGTAGGGGLSGQEGGMAGMGGGMSGDGANMTPDRELELLGDLHSRQGKINEAISAYVRALAKVRETKINPNDKTQFEGANNRLRGLAKKLAELHLKQGDLEGAKKALTVDPLVVPPAHAGTVKPPATAASNVPGKFIISISKRNLDLIGGGMVTPAEAVKMFSIEIPNAK